MTKAGDLVVHCCTKLNRYPSLIGCFLLIILQACCIDYYLVTYLGMEHLVWGAGDLIVIILFIICYVFTSMATKEVGDHGRQYTVLWVTWLLGQVLLVAKVIVICSTFSTDLDEVDFFGPNTLKTAVALGSGVFVLLVMSQHDSAPGPERRRYVEQLTGTVVFDILDTADILDVLFDADDRMKLSSGLPETIMAVAALNLLLPTVPLITLSVTKFGEKKLSKKWIYIHRLVLVLLVNVPNLIVRMVLWHGFSVGITPFTLKNILAILMTAFEFYEHKREKFEMHEKDEAGEEMEKMIADTGITDGNDQDKVHKRNCDRPSPEKPSVTVHHKNEPEISFGLESRLVTSTEKEEAKS